MSFKTHCKNVVNNIDPSIYFTNSKKINKFTTQIPFKLVDRLMIIEGEINNKKGNFIIDTGSETLILNKKYFDLYQFNFEKKGETSGVTGNLENPFEKTIEKMRLQNLDLNDVHSDIIDLSHIEKSKKIKLLGIIGFSILKDFEIFIDLYLNQITLTKIDKFGQKIIQEDYLEDIIDTVHFSLKKHTIVIEASINNEKLHFGLDTGAELNQINSSVNKKVLSSFRPKKRIKLIGASKNEIEVIYGNLHRLKLNDNNYFGPMKTILTNLSNLNKAFGTDLDGILGHDFFEQKRVIINYKKQELYFIKYPILR